MTPAPNLQPCLVGDLVRLDPTTSQDWEALYAVASDPLIWEVHPAHDRWREPVFRTFFEQGLASGGSLTARDPSTGAVIGSSRYSTERAGPGEVEIGWTFLARSAWGGAVNAAMKALMVTHALQHFDRVIFLVGENNLRSRRAMEKIGGTLIERTHDAVMAGQVTRHVIYTIDHWPAAAA